MRRFLVLFAAVAGLAFTGSAAAFPVDGAGYQTFSPYNFCAPYGTNQLVFSSQYPIRVRYGWGALQPSQLDKFLKVQYGSIIVYDSGTPIVDDTWAAGDTTGWSAYIAQTGMVPPGGGATRDGWSTRKHTDFGTLEPGTYTFDMNLGIASTVQDGFGSYQRGAIISITGCTFTVV